MKSFAFIVCPNLLEQLRGLKPVLKLVPGFLLKSGAGDLMPFTVSHIKRIRSSLGEEIEGHIIACPLINSMGLKREAILDRLIRAVNLAKLSKPAILGLNGCASIIENNGYAIQKNLKIPVTTGKTLTAWSILESVYRTVKNQNIALENSKLTIIQATSPIGILCAKKFSEFLPRIVLCADNSAGLNALKEEILCLNSVEITLEKNADEAVKDADIVIEASGAGNPAFDHANLKPKSIFCSICHKEGLGATGQQKGIITINAGLIRPPFPASQIMRAGLPKGTISASLAETMLLTFEEKIASYFLTDSLNADRLEEIADIAVRHGFEVWAPQAPIL
jgi:predicted amino acid dehydrogenase